MDYYSLDLQITKEYEGFLNLYRASILENGEIKASHSFELRRDLKLSQMLDRIEEKTVLPYPQPNQTVHIEFGKMLYNAAFSGEVGDYFNKRFNEAKDENCGLRVSLRISEDIPEIATLPWEYLHDGEEFFVTGRKILLSRLPFGVKRIESPLLDTILRMLIIISGPDDPRISPLNAEKEQEIILEAVDELYKEQKIKIDFTEDATLENIQGYLNKKKYQIVHFTGHGISIEGKGHLVFETRDRKARLIDNKTLASLFLNKGIRLVVLSSCESAKGSNKEAYGDIASVLLTQGIPAVVAMQYSVLDDVAIQFAFNFYKAIVSDEPVDLALEKTRIKMKKSEKSNGFDFATPVLYLSDCNCIRIGKLKSEPAEFENKPMMLHDLQVIKKGFVAREKELRNLERDLSSDVKRVAIIHGLGGTGKTVLATRLALRMNEYFDGIFGMKCTSTTQPGDILVKFNNFLIKKGGNELNQIIDQPVPPEEKTSLLVDILNQKRFLIIFDSFENCLNDDRNDIENPKLKEFIQYILNHTTKNTKFIITTRYDFDPLEGKLASGIEHISLPELHFIQTNWLMNNFDELADVGIRKKKEIYDVIGGHAWMIGKLAELASSQGVDDLLMKLESLQKKHIEFTQLNKSYLKLDENARRLLLWASIYKEAVPTEALSCIVEDEKDVSPNIGEPLKKLLQWGFISKEQEYGMNVYSEYKIVKNFAWSKLEEEGLDKKDLAVRAGRYYENLVVQTRSLWDYLKARDYYLQAEDWESANRIVENTAELLIQWGYIELALDILDKSIKTTAGLPQVNAEYTQAKIYYLLGDIKTALEIFSNVEYRYKEYVDNRRVAAVLQAIGTVHQDQGNYEEAVKKYNQALKIFEEVEDKNGIGITLHNLGIIHNCQKNNEEAVKKYNQALRVFEEIGDKRGIASTLHNIGIVYQDQGDYEEAVKKYNKSLIIKEEIGDKSGIASTLRQLGIIYQSQGNYEEAMKDFSHALRIFEDLRDNSGIAKTLHHLGIIHYLQGNYLEAEKNYNQSLKIDKELGRKSGIASSLHEIGNAYFNQCNYEEAAKYFNQSLKIDRDLGNKNGIAYSLHSLGMIYQNQGNYKEAVKNYYQSLRIKEDLRDKSGTARTLHNLGMIYQSQGNYEEAVKNFNQALKIKEELGDKDGIASTLHHLGMIYQNQGNYKEAVEKYHQSLRIDDELGDKKGIANILGQLGIIHYFQGNYEEAVKNFNRALKAFEGLGDKGGIASALHGLGNVYYFQGNHEEAVKMYNQSLKIAEELEDRNGIEGTLHQLGMIDQEQGNYEEAVKKYNQSLKIAEELGDRNGVAGTLHQLGRINEEEEEYCNALSNYIASYLIFKQLNSPYEKIVLGSLSKLRNKMGEEVFNAELKVELEKQVKDDDA